MANKSRRTQDVPKPKRSSGKTSKKAAGEKYNARAVRPRTGSNTAISSGAGITTSGLGSLPNNTVAELTEQVKIITKMAQQGQITTPVYNSGLLMMAWELSKAKRADLGLTILSNVSPLFIQEDLPRAAAANPALLDAIEGIAKMLIEQGHIAEEVWGPPQFVSTEIGRA